MDPNTTHEAMLELARKARALFEEADEPTTMHDIADQLATAVFDLDEWLTRGGFPPQAWTRGHLEDGPKTVTGWVRGSPDLGSYTVRGLIEQLQNHVAIDPTRADDPVTIWAGNGQGISPANVRLVPVLVAATGNDDPAVGGPRQVWLHAFRQIAT